MATLTSAAVATNDIIRATDHNKVVTDVGTVNEEAELALILALQAGG